MKKLLCLFISFLFFVPHVIYSSELSSHISSAQKTRLQQAAAFKNKKNAEKFVKKLRNEGYETVIRKSAAKGKKAIYRVYVKKIQEPPEEDVSPSVKKEPTVPSEDISTLDNPVERASPSLDRNPPLHASREGISGGGTLPINPEEPPAVEKKPGKEIIVSEVKKPARDTSSVGEIKNDTTATKPSAEERPIGIVGQRPTEAVFGSRGGFLHPFLSVTEYYTDNVFYSRNNKKSDFATVISPGIWLTVPHVYEKLLTIETSSISPGGFSLSRFETETFKRYQAYLFYNADIEQFARFSDQNDVNHKAEGLFLYNFRGGLSMELVDQFIKSHDERGTTITPQLLDKFKTNLGNFSVRYELSDRFKVRADYSNFFVHYEDTLRNGFRDRDDNAFSGYLFYKVKPKTAVFIEYEFIDIAYDTDTSLNSREHHYYGGVEWDITAKSKGTVKTGYGRKDFTDPNIKNNNSIIMEAQIDYKFTPKTSVILKASRSTNETNVETTDYVLSNTVQLEYLQKLTGKITGDVRFSYSNEKYTGDLTFSGLTKKLQDNYYLGAFALQYKFKEWLQLDLGYIYDRRDSNFSEFDYVSNIVLFRITGQL